MKLPKFTQPVNHSVVKLKLADTVWEQLQDYKAFYEETYQHKIEDATGKQDAMSLFLEKMLESFMKEDKEFNRRKKEKSVKLKKEDKSVVLSHKNETVSSVSVDKGQNLNKSMVQEPSKDTKIIEKELFGEAE